MRTILSSLKVNHAVNARKRSALTATAVRIEFLFDQYVATRLLDSDAVLDQFSFKILNMKRKNI